MRKSAIGFMLFLLVLAGCSHVPQPTTYPSSRQQKMQAGHHWDVLAEDMAGQVAAFIKSPRTQLIDSYGIYVEPQKGVFGRAFTRMLIGNLVKEGIPVTLQQEAATPVLRFDTQLIKHKANRVKWPPPGTLTALATGIYVLRHITWDTLAALSVPIVAGGELLIGSSAELSHHEVLITTMLIKKDEYLLYNNDLYYLNDLDWWHYPTEDIPEPEDVAEVRYPTVKTFEVKGGHF